MPSFEEAKKEWLKEVGNKSWDQLSAEHEAESEAKAEKLMTPEYVESWGKAKSDGKGEQ